MKFAKNSLFVLVIMLSFFSTSMIAKAADHGLKLEAVVCPFSGSVATEDDYFDCLDKYEAGELNTYLLKDGDNVEDGTLIMGVVKYIYKGVSEVTSFSGEVHVDTNLWEYEYAYADDSVMPCKSKRECGWSVAANYEENDKIIYLSGADQKYDKGMDDNYNILYFFLKVNTTASGAKLPIAFSEPALAKTGDNNRVVAVDIDPINSINLSLAGGPISNDNTLKTLTAKNGSTSYPISGFVSGSKEVRNYSVVVPNSTSSIDLVAEANDENVQGVSISKIGGTASDRSLSVGNNNFNIIVVAQNGDTETYTLNIKRLSNVATLNGITFTNGISISGFSSGTKSYTINNVPYATKNTNITATLTDSNATIESGDGSWNFANHGSTVNTRNIVVRAENCKTEYASVPGNACSKETYTINLYRIAPSTNKLLSSLSVNGTSVPSFNENTKTYTVTVPNNTSSVNVLGVVKDTGKANVTSGNGSHNINVGDNSIDVVVTAEDGSTDKYTITVHRLNNDATLKSLTATSSPSGTFSPNFSGSFTGDYTYSFDATVNNVTVNAAANDTTYATVGLTDTSSGATPIVGTSNTASATYSSTTKSVAAFVTAEDGTTKTYTLKFSRAQSSNVYLSGITVTNGSTTYPLSPTFRQETKSYNVTVDSDVASVTVNGTPADSNSQIISGNGPHNLNFGYNNIEIRLQAENKQYGSYFVNVTRRESSDARLATLTVDGTPIAGFDPDTETYTLNKVGFSKTSINIDGKFKDSNASFVSGNGTVNLNTGDNALKVVTRAQDGTTKTYTINVEREKNTDTSVKSVMVRGVPATKNSEGKYEVTLENNVSSLTPSDIIIAVGDDATVTKSSDTFNLVTTSVNKYTFTVTAEDTTKITTYEILITRKKDTDTSIRSVTITLDDHSTRSCTMSGNSCIIDVPVTTTGFNLNADINSTSTMSPVNGSYFSMGPTESTKDITLTVTAEDGVTEDNYTVTVARQKSSNNDLSDLKVNGTTVADFDGVNKSSYNISVPAETTNVNISATVADTGRATIVTDLSNPFDLNFGLNTIEVVVKAENNQRKIYTLNITRERGKDATLSSLTVNGNLIDNFSATKLEYTIDAVDFETNSINIGATPNDPLAHATGTDDIALNTGDNQIIVTVTAHDGTTKQEYKINVKRAFNTDASVKSVMVHGVPATKNSEGKYEVTLENNVSSLAPSDVVIAISNDATITKPTNTIDLVTTSVNNYSFSVTAEDVGVVRTYEILITRKKSTDVSIGTVRLTLNDGSTRSCTMSGTSCTIEVPVTTTGFDLNASINSTSSIDPANDTHFDMGPSESTKNVDLTVTAEDGTTTRDYKVTVVRQKSDDNDLSDLTVNGTTVDDFDANDTFYEISVPAGISEVTIGATVHDTGKATVETDLSNPFPLNFGSNTIDVVVKAENDRTKTYKLNITREKGIDATLSDLKVNGATISGFSPNTFEYTLSSVDYNTVAENIGATPNDPLATVTGTGSSIALNTGDNAIIITVTAHDGITKQEYKINVNRAKNTDTGIKGISVAGVSATKVDANNYTVTVPNNVTVADLTNVVVDVNDPKLSTDLLATYTLIPLNLSTKVVNNLAITVTSESGNTATYSVAITREKSNVATLETLTVTNGSFSPSFTKDRLEYNVNIPVDATGFDVDATKTDVESTINSGTGHYDMATFTSPVKVVVVSEDGNTTNTYILNIKRTESSVNTLSGLTVSSGADENTVTYSLTPGFTPEGTRYTVEVPGTIDNIDIDATLTDARANIEYGTGNHTLNVGSNPITLRVRSESGSPLDYTIIVNRAKKTDALLTDLTIDGITIPNFDQNVKSYDIADPYPNSKTSINIGATTSDIDATVTGTGNKALVTGTNTFNVVVTAEDGTTTETYVINVTRNPSENNKLSLLSINGMTLSPSFDPDTLDYEITVPETKEELKPSEVTAIPDDSNARATKDPTLTLLTTTDNYYSITVTAENGQPRVYSIKVNRPKSTDAKLKEVKLNGASLTPVFNPDTDSYTLNVPYGATSFEIEGIPNVSTTEVFGNGTYNVADQSTITLTTRAEAGGAYSKTYTFNIVEALSTDATLNNLGVSGYPFKDPNSTFNSAITTYDIGNIPYGTSEVLINAEPTNPTSTLEYYVGTNKQTSNRVTIPQVPGSNSITVKVTAPDGITQKDYIINYSVVLSDNAYLRSLVPSVGVLAFNKTNFAYELNVSNDVDTIDFDVITEDNNARITVKGNIYATPKKITLSDLQVGNTILSILVTAQDNQSTQTYDVVIKKAAPIASSDATLGNLSVDGYPFATAFDPETEDYTIGSIPFNLDTLTINATANIGASKISYFVNGVAQVNNVVSIPKVDGNGEVIVRVTAEDGLTVKNYHIDYSKTANDNAFLSNINLSHGSITFDKNNQNYTIDVDADVNSVDVTAFTEDSNATISVDGTTHSSPYTITLPLNNGTNPLNIVVTAEDGTTSLTYSLIFNKGDDISDKITSDAYGHTIDSGYIKSVKLGTIGSELKDQLDNPNEYLEIWDADETTKIGDGDTLATGMIVKLMINGVEEDRQVIVVKGDTTGDGDINPLDSVLVVNHYLGVTTLSGAYYEAALLTDDADVDPLDSVLIINHYLGTSLLY